MSHIVPQDICIRILEDSPIAVGYIGGMENLTKEQACAYLKKLTGVDFGNDTVAWRKWFRENQPHVANVCPMGRDEMNIAIIEERPSIHLIGWQETKEDARRHLIKLTGQDFGYDGEAWRQWYRENRSELAKRFVYG